VSEMLGQHPTVLVFLCALVTALATGLGAVPFAFIRSLSPRVIAYANAVAAGLMLGASLGLLDEGVARDPGRTFLGAAGGVGFILFTQRLLGEREIEFASLTGQGARRTLLLMIVMTVHSFAEGVAVGVSFGGGEALAIAITVALAVHNIPEGLAITVVMRSRGVSLLACGWWSVVSSLPQPLTAVPAFLLVHRVRGALPYGLGFAAGAMIYMVFIELLPEAYHAAERRPIATLVGLTTIAMLLFQRSL
jgi:ZIP family zinc transporter